MSVLVWITCSAGGWGRACSTSRVLRFLHQLPVSPSSRFRICPCATTVYTCFLRIKWGHQSLFPSLGHSQIPPGPISTIPCFLFAVTGCMYRIDFKILNKNSHLWLSHPSGKKIHSVWAYCWDFLLRNTEETKAVPTAVGELCTCTGQEQTAGTHTWMGWGDVGWRNSKGTNCPSSQRAWAASPQTFPSCLLLGWLCFMESNQMGGGTKYPGT